jgi:hypothetical protein
MLGPYPADYFGWVVLVPGKPELALLGNNIKDLLRSATR